MVSETTQVVKVSIYGDDYPIRARLSDEEYLRRVASYVDSRMREVHSTMKPSSTLKVAILAALNIADELLTTQEERRQVSDLYRERIATLSGRLDELLEPSETE